MCRAVQLLCSVKNPTIIVVKMISKLLDKQLAADRISPSNVALFNAELTKLIETYHAAQSMQLSCASMHTCTAHMRMRIGPSLLERMMRVNRVQVHWHSARTRGRCEGMAVRTWTFMWQPFFVAPALSHNARTSSLAPPCRLVLRLLC